MPTELSCTSRVPSGHPGGMREFRLWGHNKKDGGHQQYRPPKHKLEGTARGFQPTLGALPRGRADSHSTGTHQVYPQQKTTGTMAQGHQHADALVESDT